MRKRSAGIAALVLLSLACVLLVGCGSGGERTRAAGQPTESSVSGLGKLAYELDGTIYVKDLPDGAPVRLTEGAEPRWSPSGQWLLADGNDSQWVMGSDGSEKRALSSMPAVWSPKDDRLAYSEGAAIYVENADGLAEQEVASVGAAYLVWSADGTRLAFSRLLTTQSPSVTSKGQIPVTRYASLWVADADGKSVPDKLLESTTDGFVTAGWSADSRCVLYWLDPEFGNSMMNDGLPTYAIPAGGGEPQKLTSTLHNGVWESSPLGGCTVLLTEGESRMTWTGERIALADASTGRVTYLTSDDTASQQPDWSRDGRQIVYVSQPDRGMGPGGSGSELEGMAKDRRIWVMNADGSDRRQLTDDPAYRDESPLWSADGSQVLFARLDSERHASLWMVPSAGGEATRVVDAIGSSAEPLTGYYTNIGWGGMFDWWQVPPPH